MVGCCECFPSLTLGMSRGFTSSHAQTSRDTKIIICTAETEEEHDEILRQVCQRLRDHNITIGRDKCLFGKQSVDFYGRTLSADGITASKNILSAITAAGAPQNASEVRSFLGMTQYNARFIPSYSDIVAPMQKLVRQSEIWRWEEEQQKAFETPKEYI